MTRQHHLWLMVSALAACAVVAIISFSHAEEAAPAASGPVKTMTFTADEEKAITGNLCEWAKYGFKAQAEQVCAYFAKKFSDVKAEAPNK